MCHRFLLPHSIFSLRSSLLTPRMEHNMPSDISDDDGQDRVFTQEVARTCDELPDSPQGSGNWADRPESSQSSAPDINPVQRPVNPPLLVRESELRRRRKKHPAFLGQQPQSAIAPVEGPTGMYISFLLSPEVISIYSRGYAPSQPFEEAGRTSSIWRAYLDESLIYDTDMLGNQRGQVNILLVFVSSFSQICPTSVELISPVGRTVLGNCERLHCAILNEPSARLSAIIGVFAIRSDQYTTCACQWNLP